jgi:pyridoxamine 5'-phosphate oxidase
MDLWNASLAEIEIHAWELLEQGVLSHKNPFHYGTFINIANHLPQGRTVILRKADKALRELHLNVDVRSQKVSSLKENNNCAWLFYDTNLRMQIRCNGKAIVNYQNEFTEHAWNLLRKESQLTYSQKADPGSLLDEPELIEMKRDPEDSVITFAKNNFSIIHTQIQSMEIVLLSYKGNRRAIFDYENGIVSWKQV